jgi:transketolase
MRGTLVKTLLDLAQADHRIMLLTGDLGFTALEPFFEKFPHRFFNVGVAEQNMVGLATGLAEAGFIPYVYSIVTFATLRPYEFIRNGPILQQFPVRIIGVGGGMEYGHDGATHYGLEDVGIMRIQPGITVIAPADYQQAQAAFLTTWDLPGPIYYRISKDDRTTIPGLGGRFELGRAQLIRSGTDLAMISMGPVTNEVTSAADLLAEKGVSCSVVVIASLSPAPVSDLARILRSFRRVFTIEAHYVVGGLGSLVSEVIAENGLSCRLVRLGIKTLPDGISGSQAFMYQRHGISREALVEAVFDELGGNRRKGFPRTKNSRDGRLNVSRD